jgi:pimeloyl-ACP methyl ester carboxylesterase
MTAEAGARLRGRGRFRKERLATVALLCCIGAVGCSAPERADEQSEPIAMGAPGGGTGGSLTPTPPPAAVGNTPQGGASAQGTSGAGAAAAGTMASVPPPVDASTRDAEPATGPSEDAAVERDGGDAGGDPPDVPGPTDFAAKGPHEVVVEKNVGERFRNDVADDTFFCEAFIGGIGGSNPDVNEELTTYPADMDRGLYTLFRPAKLEEGRTYPVLTWGNGTCSHPLLFSELIEHVASHGFIVIATNSRQTAGGVEMLHGVDFVLSENENSSSVLYGKIDEAMVGAFGHSQGSGATLSAGADPRIVVTVPIQGASAAGVRALRGPTFLIAGERDTLVAPAGVETSFNAATVPAVYGLSMGQDHLMPGVAPGPILDAVTAWFRLHLAGDAEARELFYGNACKLCSDPRWKLQRRNL